MWLSRQGVLGFLLGYFIVGELMHWGLFRRDLFVAVGSGMGLGIVMGVIGFQMITHRLRPFFSAHFTRDLSPNE